MKLNQTHVEMILQSTSRCWLERKLKLKYKRIYAKIFEQTEFLLRFNSNPSVFERLFCIQHSLSEPPLCKTCRMHHVKFDVKRYSYRKWCSPKCQASDPDCITLSKRTRSQKYGNENYNGVEKSRTTRKSANGGKWHADDFGDKVKARKVANGHDENWTNSELAKCTISKKLKDDPDFWKKREQKSIATKIANGHDGKWNNRDKFKKTLASFSEDKIEHRSKALSDAYQSKTDSEKTEIVEKRKTTCIELCGYFPMMLEPNTKAEIEHGMLKKYGVKNGFQLEKCKIASNNARTKKTYEYLMNCETDSPNFSIDILSEHKKDPLYEYEFTCNKCNHTFRSTIGKSMGIHGKCPTCFPHNMHGTSKAELELAEFIKTYGYDIIQHDRKIIKPLELDMVIPTLNIAIEYDGLYWHCEQSPNYTGPNQHVLKTNMCENTGYRLIHVFENEWIWKKDIVKSAIAEIVGKSSRTINAEECETKFIDCASATLFITENCIFEPANSSVNIGLFYKDELVSVMTFCKSRFNKKYEWEILRTCNKINVTVHNAILCMLNKFEYQYHPTSLVIYADRRWDDGKTYEQLGFNKTAVTKPDYWFFSSSVMYLYPKTKFRKVNIENALASYDPSKTELENMQTNKWCRIFDCGKNVFVKNYSQHNKQLT